MEEYEEYLELDLSTYLSTFQFEEEEEKPKETLWTEDQLRAMLGQEPKKETEPKYVLKDEGGWYLRRKSLKIDNQYLLWTHNRQEARHLRSRVDALLLRDRLNTEWERKTIEVTEVWN